MHMLLIQAHLFIYLFINSQFQTQGLARLGKMHMLLIQAHLFIYLFINSQFQTLGLARLSKMHMRFIWRAPNRKPAWLAALYKGRFLASTSMVCAFLIWPIPSWFKPQSKARWIKAEVNCSAFLLALFP
jgi:hypothetical protein